jgi:outer membrane murein-binding lipoprotein Lpp
MIKGFAISLTLLAIGQTLFFLVVMHAICWRHGALMKTIQEFKTVVDAAFAKINAAVSGLSTDIKTLNEKITALQNSGGTLTEEDQATLNDIATTAGAIADKAEALDAITAPPQTTETGAGEQNTA